LPYLARAGLIVLAGATGAWSQESNDPPRPRDLEASDSAVVEVVESALASVQADPQAKEGWANLGSLYFAHGFLSEARQCLQRAARGSLEPKWTYWLALVQAELGDLEEALVTTQNLVSIDQPYPPVHWRRGLWYLDRSRIEEAEAAFRAAVELAPDDPNGWIGLARVALQTGRYAEAVPSLQRVLSKDPSHAYALLLLASAWQATGERLRAAPLLKTFAGAKPEFSDPWQDEIHALRTGLGNILLAADEEIEQGRAEEVAQKLKALRERYPDNVLLLNKLSEAYLKLGQADPALTVLNAALAVDPDSFATHLHLAQAQRFSGRLPEALAAVERSLQITPRMWPTHVEKAQILTQLGRYQEAVNALEQALDYGGHQKADTWLALGVAHLKARNWEQAIVTFEQAAHRFPFLPRAYSGLAAARAESGDLAAAKEALLTAQRLNPADPAVEGVARRIAQLEAAEFKPQEHQE